MDNIGEFLNKWSAVQQRYLDYAEDTKTKWKDTGRCDMDLYVEYRDFKSKGDLIGKMLKDLTGEK